LKLNNQRNERKTMKEIHQLNVFPPMSGAELIILADSIRKDGLLEPICLLEGKILDGRNREMACELVGYTARYRDFSGGFAGACDRQEPTEKA
jgi:ParB-like chromosome segregation protein Spo0J